MVPFENKVIKDTIHNVLIRPIDPELLEDTSDSIQLYYKKFNYHEIWYLDENRKDLLNEIKFCDQEGLLPEDYSLARLEAFEKKRNTLSDEQLAEYDILLTQSFEKIALHLFKGKLNPKEIPAFPL